MLRQLHRIVKISQPTIAAAFAHNCRLANVCRTAANGDVRLASFGDKVSFSVCFLSCFVIINNLIVLCSVPF